MTSKLTVSRVVIAVSIFSLVLQIGASWYLIPKLSRPIEYEYLLLALVLEFLAFAVLAPFTKRFYALEGARFTYRRAFSLLLASESFSRLVPFGDFFVQRYYFNRHALPKAAPLRYITVLYTFALLSLIVLFLTFQVAVFVLYPSQISSSFAGKFVLIPLTITGFIIALFVLRRSPTLSRTIQEYAKRHLGSTLDSPIAILERSNLSKWRTTLLLAPLALTWLIEAGAYIACLKAFGVEAPILLGLYAYMFVKMFRFIPLFPGGVGEIEATSALLFSAYGYAVAPIITGSILFRFVSYWFPIAMGALVARTILAGRKRPH